MKKFLKDALSELKILEKNSEKDYLEKEYNAYEHYIQEYNQILKKLKGNNFFESTSFITYVPEGEKAYMGIGSTAEVSKHKEVVIETQKLIQKIENDLGIKLKRGSINVNKTAFWGIVPLILSIIGGAYYLGKDIGLSKFDKEKISYEKQNALLNEELDSLKVSYANSLELCENLQSKLELYEKLDINNKVNEILSRQLDECISKVRLMSSKYDKRKYENWKEEVLIVLEKIDNNDSEKFKDYFIEKIKECERLSSSVNTDVYDCAIETLQKIKIKMK